MSIVIKALAAFPICHREPSNNPSASSSNRQADGGGDENHVIVAVSLPVVVHPAFVLAAFRQARLEAAVRKGTGGGRARKWATDLIANRHDDDRHSTFRVMEHGYRGAGAGKVSQRTWRHKCGLLVFRIPEGAKP